MDLGLSNKVVLVLAASKGLGLACAKGFYKEGASVVICSRSRVNLDLARREIEKINSSNSNSVIAIETDLNDKEQIKSLIDSTIKEYGTIDVLIHNAGGPPSASIDNITEKMWHDSINLNLLSFIRICKSVIPIMESQQFGRIIAIASVSVKQPLENLVLSNTARLGVVGYAKSLANAYAKDNILVNVVCPGPTLTNRMRELIKKQGEETRKSEGEIMRNWVDSIPLGRLGTPEELANLVIFLSSARASYITGTVIQVDGGFVRSSF